MISAHILDVCRIGQYEKCCKYLVADEKGFECMKMKPENKAFIDKQWKLDAHVAQGDNCEGRERHILNHIIHVDDDDDQHPTGEDDK